MILKELCKPFPPSEIEWRVGSTNGDKTQGLALAYLTARHVMDRLDEVCGVDGWQDRYEFHGARTVCYLSIRVGDQWVTKADGAGDSDVEAEKGAISDALKRAAVKWGIGRYLYSLGNTWVAIEPAGRSYKIKSTEYAKLETSLVRQFGGEVELAPMQQISAYRAKQLLKTDVLLEQIDTAKNEGRCDELVTLFDTELRFLPGNWIDQFKERIAQRRAALAKADDAPPPVDPHETLNQQFRDTIGVE